MLGPLLIGWGPFNLVEGVVNHHLLGLYHVHDDVPDPLWWDAGFLLWGAVLVAIGLAVHWSASPASRLLDSPRG